MQPQHGAGNPLAEYYRRTRDQTSGGRGSEWGIQPKCCLNNCAQIEETHKPHQLRCLQCGWGHWCSLVCYALDNTRYNDGCFNRSSGAHPLHCSGTDPVQKEQNLSAVDDLMNPSSKKRCCDCCGKVTPLDGEEEGEKKKKFQTCVSILFVCCTTTYFCSFGFFYFCLVCSLFCFLSFLVISQSRCKRVRYCSKACQAFAWEYGEHKYVCVKVKVNKKSPSSGGNKKKSTCSK